MGKNRSIPDVLTSYVLEIETESTRSMDKNFLQEVASRLALDLKTTNATNVVQSRFERLCLLGMKDAIADSLQARGAAGLEEIEADIAELEKQIFDIK
jgi:hypothetical protein